MAPLMYTLRALIREPRTTVALAQAAREHWQMERVFRRMLQEVPSARHAAEFPHLELPWSRYFERNFFSILFLSIYRALGIPAERRLHYGLIAHALRGVVTAADNLLDSEDKGAVRLRLRGGRVLQNVTAILLQDGVLHEAIDAVARAPRQRTAVRQAISDALLRIAVEESAEEDPVDTALPPRRILDEIHSLRGGALLQLAFVAPAANEPDLRTEIAAARQGVHRIGLGLQVLDDVTDFRLDIRRRNHNILRSWVVHAAPDGPATNGDLREMPPEKLAAPECAFPQAVRAVLELAMELALDGFERLHAIGHPINRQAARRVARKVFELRGLRHLWDLYEDAPAAAPPDLAKANRP